MTLNHPSSSTNNSTPSSNNSSTTTTTTTTTTGSLDNNNNNPQAGQNRPLPKKEADLFKHLVKNYEGKQYKKAIKSADLILRKYPNHGETLCMKGLTLYYFHQSSASKKEEAHELVKLGLRNDMRSHVCWHVYGLLHRADRNYLEAIKAYKQALRMDGDNLQILRDLSLLQIQMRDLHGFVQTRNAILTLKPNAQLHWLTFAVAKHLLNDITGALQIIDIYLSTLVQGTSDMLERNYEPSELHLYKSTLLLQLNEPQQALEHLNTCQPLVMDRGAWLWHVTLCNFKLSNFKAAKETLMTLFHRGATDDYKLQAAYQCAVLEIYDEQLLEHHHTGMDTLATLKVLTQEQCKILLHEYTDTLQKAFPRSKAVARMPLPLLLQQQEQLQITTNHQEIATSSADPAKTALQEYLQRGLKKGIPSLAHDLSSLLLLPSDDKDGATSYRRVKNVVETEHHVVYQMILSLVQEYLTTVETQSTTTNDNDATTTCSSSTTPTKNDADNGPSTNFWCHYFMAGWLELAGKYAQALSECQACLDHTPTAVDVYEIQARLYQKSGSMPMAVTAMDTGRHLDQQDRYMNNMTTKFMLQAGQPELALERIGLFTDAKSSGGTSAKKNDPNATLYDMQCSWYELELGDCLKNMGDYGKALQKYAAVMKHFDDIHEDQFDFHSYCIRKVTLRAYCKVLEWEDDLWGQPYYRRAAEGTIRIYLLLHDDPSLLRHYKEPDYTGMSAAEKKKAKAIARKKKKKADAEATTEHEEQEATIKEIMLKDALGECQKYSAILSKHASKELSTWMLQYDVAIRRNKVLLALQALVRAHALDPNSSELLTRIVDFGLKKDTIKSATSGAGAATVIGEVIDSEFPLLIQNHGNVADYVTALAKRTSSTPANTTITTATTSLGLRVALMKALVDTKVVANPEEAASQMIVNDNSYAMIGGDVDTCRYAYKTMVELGATKTAATWKEDVVMKQFPLVTDI